MSGFIFGRPINEATQKALERKQALVGTRIASREGFAGLAREFFNIRTPWVKLSSAVAITDDAKLDYFGESFDLALAELNVLYSLDTYENNTLAETRNLSEYYGGNLNLRKEHTAGTVSYEDYGPRPKPGITGVTVTSHGMYGALRTVTVNFKCWTPYQLDIMDNLYMRPGYTMLLEFGHSHYLAGEDYDYTIEDEMLLIDLYKGGYLSKEVNDFDKVYADIQSKKIQYGGAYEGFLGVVKNFSWSFTLDGGYDCSIDLVSKGEIIESITANAGASVTASGNLTESTKLGRILQGLSRINNLIPGQNNWYELPNREYNLDKADQNSTDQNFLTYYKQSFNTGDKDVDQPQPQTYITLQTLNSYLNADLLKDGTNGDTSYIKLDTAFEESKYYTNNLQISIDPLVCLLPKGASTKAIFPNFFYETRKNQPQSEVEIKDILLNVNFLKKAIRSSLTDDGQIEVKAFYDRVFKGIEESTGGINKFELHCDENNTFYIIDRKYIEVTGDRPQPLYLSGLSSIVKNISLTSKLSPNLSTLIAISAQDKSSDLGLDATSFRKLNSGLEDRVTGEKVSGGVSLNTSTYRFTEDDEAGTIHIEKTDFFETLQASIAKLYNGTDSVETNKRGLQSLYSGFLNTALEKSTAAHASFAIPFELTLTLDGTGGFTVGETFEINGDILPLTYKETIFNGMGFTITQNSRVGFIITSLEQNISSAGWNTLIKSQIYLNSESDVKPRTYKTDPLNNSSDEESQPPAELLALESTKSIDSLHPDFKPVIQRIMKKLEEQGYQPVLGSAWRSIRDQIEKFEQGRSQVKVGNHNTVIKNQNGNFVRASTAVDIIDSRYGWEPDPGGRAGNPEDYSNVATFFKALGAAVEADPDAKKMFRWGGDYDKTNTIWKYWGMGWDPAHVEWWDNKGKQLYAQTKKYVENSNVA